MADSASAPAQVDAAAVIDEQPGFKVFAGNLAYATTDEGLQTFFSPVAGDILSSQVIFRGTRPAGYGFVAFKTAEAAQKAVDLLNKKELDGRTLIVEVAKPIDQKEKRPPKKRSKKPKETDAPATNGNTNGTTTTTNGPTDALEVKDVPDSADATKPKKKRTFRKKPKSKAAKEGDAAAATPADGAASAAPVATEPKPKKVKAPKAPKVARPIGEAPAGEPSKTMLFVANLGFSVDDAALSELFTSAGINVTTARVVRRRWGHPRKSKGYGFVDVGSEDEQKKALELLQGKEVGGREIAVKIAVNSQEKEAREAAQADGMPLEITGA